METSFLQNQITERYQLALEAAGIGIWDNDILNDKILFPGNSYELFGLVSGDNVSLQKLLEHIHTADREKVIYKLQRSLDPGIRAFYDNEYRIIDVNSKEVIRWIRTKGKAYFTDEKIAYRITGTVQDISEEIKTRETHQKLLALVDNSIELMSILENDQKNSYINKAGMEMLGFDNLEQAIQTPISNLHTPEDIAFVEANVLPSVINTGRWSGIMNVRHLQTGEVFPVHNNTVRIHDNITGEPIAIGAVMRDIRPEMAAKKALEESVRNFQELVMQAPFGICIFQGENLVIEIVNENFQALVNKQKEQLVNKIATEVFPEMLKYGFHTMLLSVLKSLKPVYGKEVKIEQEINGAEHPAYFDFTLQPLYESDGSVTRIMSVAIDVTDKVLAKKTLKENEDTLVKRVAERTRELEIKNKELEEFTYVSSHDLQEPIRKIKIFGDMIRERDFDNLSEFSKEKFNKVGDAIERMSRSLKDLLNFAGLNKKENSTTVNLNEVIANVKNDLELLIDQKKATITYDNLPSITAVSSQIHQLFYNLINNAIKFSKENISPEIKITTEINNSFFLENIETDPAKDYCIISISDNGIGFEQAFSSKIFEMFQRLHTRDVYDGTGIGLALCKKITQNHGGSIWVHSTPGIGSCFYVTLATGK